jgi:hypothetical protein
MLLMPEARKPSVAVPRNKGSLSLYGYGKRNTILALERSIHAKKRSQRT